MTDSTDSKPSPVLWECDSCAYREWRPADQEPWLCVICGYERWRQVKDQGNRGNVPGH